MVTLLLLLITVDGQGREAVAAEPGGDVVAVALSLAENDGALAVVDAAQDVLQL